MHKGKVWKPIHSYIHQGVSYLIYARLKTDGLMEFKTVRVSNPFHWICLNFKIDSQKVFEELTNDI